MHFVFRAKWEEDSQSWTAYWAEGPEAIFTEGITKEELEKMIVDAVGTHLKEEGAEYTFEVIYEEVQE